MVLLLYNINSHSFIVEIFSWLEIFTVVVPTAWAEPMDPLLQWLIMRYYPESELVYGTNYSPAIAPA
jgi:hypothetical protein